MRGTPLPLLLLLCLAGTAHPEAPVEFADAILKAAVEDTLWISDPTPADMLGLTSLTCVGSQDSGARIRSISGLEYALNLQDLPLRAHRIQDISPLAGLVNLRTVNLDNNEIRDISPLSGLTGLWTVDLTRNSVSDCSPLSGLTELGTLSLHRNQIGDISPLTSLTSLTWFDLRINPLNQEAYETHIDQILENNPGIWFVYDPHFHRRIIVDSSVGGSIAEPGEGGFTREFGEYIWLTATPAPGYRFAGWSGSYSTSENPLYLYVDQDYELTATFVRLLDTIHVDDDASSDPAPGDSRESDPQEDGTLEHPFDRIQEAINVAATGTLVLVHPGTYHENLNLRGRRIHLSGIDPNAPHPVDYPVIAGVNAGAVVEFTNYEGADCRLSGLAITQGKGGVASAIRCVRSRPTIANCLIVGNRATDPTGATIHCTDSEATFINCTIADNAAGEDCAAVVVRGGHVTLKNCIVRDIAPAQVRTYGDGVISVSHTNMSDDATASAGAIDLGAGLIHMDPLFVRHGRWVPQSDSGVFTEPGDLAAVWIAGDYHLKSRGGRWDAATGTWVQDEATSPCIDAGDPATPVGEEPSPNGAVINMGAYGGTAEASRSGSP
jgi:hypothetical protein